MAFPQFEVLGTGTEMDIVQTISGTTARNAMHITVTDSSTIAGGMSRALALEYTATGAQSGTAQINGLAIDMFIEDDIIDWMPLTIYTGTVSDKNIENFFGLSMYFEDFGNDVANFCALDIGYNSPHAPASRNCFLRCRQHTTVQAESTFALLEGNSAVTYLFGFDTAANVVVAGAGTYSSADGYLKIKVAGSAMRIPYFAGTD